jgi:membrane fusion protein, multidrug efflux system
VNRLYISVLLLLFFTIVSCRQKEQNNGKTNKPLEVRYLAIQTQPFETDLILNGNLLPNEEVSLRSEVNGRILQIRFNEGERVRKGQLLVQLDARDLEAEREKTKVLYDQAKTDLERRKGLLESKVISREEYDQFFNREKELKATLRQLDARIDQFRITAPFDGIVGLRNISTGGMVSPGEAVGSLVMNSPLKLEFSVPEQYAQLVQHNDEVKFSLRNQSDTFTAKVFATDGRISPTTRSLRVRALFTNIEADLIPGAYAKIIYPLEVHKEAVLIPTDAIISQSDGQKVMRIVAGKAVPAMVETGERTADNVLITRGLSHGDTIALTGLLYLKEGMPVTLQNSK